MEGSMQQTSSFLMAQIRQGVGGGGGGRGGRGGWGGGDVRSSLLFQNGEGPQTV